MSGLVTQRAFKSELWAHYSWAITGADCWFQRFWSFWTNTAGLLRRFNDFPGPESWRIDGRCRTRSSDIESQCGRFSRSRRHADQQSGHSFDNCRPSSPAGCVDGRYIYLLLADCSGDVARRNFSGGCAKIGKAEKIGEVGNGTATMTLSDANTERA